MSFILFALVNAAAITNKMLRICFSVLSKNFLYILSYNFELILCGERKFLPGCHHLVLMHVLEVLHQKKVMEMQKLKCKSKI